MPSPRSHPTVARCSRSTRTTVFRPSSSATGLGPSPVAWIFDREDLRAPEVVPDTTFAPVDVETEASPADDNAFDVIVWRTELVTLKDVAAPLAEVQRTLSPRGLFLLSVPNLAALHNRLPLLRGYQPRRCTSHMAITFAASRCER
jgi:hypothetical protein